MRTDVRRLVDLALLGACCAGLLLSGCETSESGDDLRAPTSTCTDLRPSDACEVESPYMRVLWENMHAARYDNIPGAIEDIKSHLAMYPDDLEANKTVAFLRTWELGELYRAKHLTWGQSSTGWTKRLHTSRRL